MDKLNELLDDLEIMYGEDSDKYNNAAYDLNNIYQDMVNLERTINEMLKEGV